MNQDYEDGITDKFVVDKIVDMTGPTTEAVDNPDAASVEKNVSEELGDGRPDELIMGKVLSSLEITQFLCHAKVHGRIRALDSTDVSCLVV